jgi:hypothetical protein
LPILLNRLDRETWNGFLLQQTYSHFYHTWDWGEFMASFRHRELLRFSIHGGGGVVLGVCTICIEPLLWFGKRADSIPVWAISGPILQDGLDPETKRTLCEELVNQVENELRGRKVLDAEIRIWDPFLDSACLEPWLRAGYGIRNVQTLMRSVPLNESEVMSTYEKSFWKEVRQGHSRGGKVEMNTQCDSDELYRLYAKTMQHAGTRPRYDREEVSYVLSWSNNLRDVYLCKYEGRTIGFAISLKFNRITIGWIAGSDRNFVRIRPMNLIFDELVRNSARQGVQTIDFGGGPTAGLSHFKRAVGANPVLHYYISKTYCNSLYLSFALYLTARITRFKYLRVRHSTHL